MGKTGNCTFPTVAISKVLNNHIYNLTECHRDQRTRTLSNLSLKKLYFSCLNSIFELTSVFGNFTKVRHWNTWVFSCTFWRSKGHLAFQSCLDPSFKSVVICKDVFHLSFQGCLWFQEPLCLFHYSPCQDCPAKIFCFQDFTKQELQIRMIEFWLQGWKWLNALYDNYNDYLK